MGEFSGPGRVAAGGHQPRGRAVVCQFELGHEPAAFHATHHTRGEQRVNSDREATPVQFRCGVIELCEPVNERCDTPADDVGVETVNGLPVAEAVAAHVEVGGPSQTDGGLSA